MSGEILKTSECNETNSMDPMRKPRTEGIFKNLQHEAENYERYMAMQNAGKSLKVQPAHETMSEIADVTGEIERLSESIRNAMIGDVPVSESCGLGGGPRLSDRLRQEFERLCDIRRILEHVRECL